MRKTLLFIVAILPMALNVLAGCGRADPDKIAEQFMDLISGDASVEKINAADDFLLAQAQMGRIDEEQTGELLTQLEAYALEYDNSSLDYAGLAERYKGEIPDYMTELFELKEIEQDAPIISDATLQVSWAELLERTKVIEDFIAAHREDSLIRDDAVWLYRRHVNAVLMGAMNSPVFDYDTHEFSAELMELYDAYIAERPYSALAGVLREYKEYLKDMDYTLLYKQKEDSAKFIETCNRLASEAEKRAYSAD
jgi:hypothetical protein